jgi:hypothetical protein
LPLMTGTIPGYPREHAAAWGVRQR